MKTIIVLLALWAILAVVGFALEGLLWLGIIGTVLFLGTLVFGLVHHNRNKAKARR